MYKLQGMINAGTIGSSLPASQTRPDDEFAVHGSMQVHADDTTEEIVKRCEFATNG